MQPIHVDDVEVACFDAQLARSAVAQAFLQRRVICQEDVMRRGVHGERAVVENLLVVKVEGHKLAATLATWLLQIDQCCQLPVETVDVAVG